MATLIVEDGSDVAGANTYVDIAYVDTYALDRGLSMWTGTADEKNAAILNSMTYMEQQPYKGYPSTSTQSLVWPRFGVTVNSWEISSDVIPSQLTKAQAEAAIRSLTAPLSPDLKRGGAIKKRKVDVIETEYFAGASNATTYPVINQLLAPLLKSSTTLVLS